MQRRPRENGTRHNCQVRAFSYRILRILRLNNRGLKRAAAKLERAWSTYCTEQVLVAEIFYYTWSSHLSLKTGPLASSRCKRGIRQNI
jgi:hypothetical protein